MASFARMFDEKEFRPGWDGTTSAGQVEDVTSWPDIPFEILRHDGEVYAAAKNWSAEVEAQWGADQAAFAALAHTATSRSQGAGHEVYNGCAGVSLAAVRQVLGAVATK